eukprot:182143-Rhodomonas_salina.2
MPACSAARPHDDTGRSSALRVLGPVWGADTDAEYVAGLRACVCGGEQEAKRGAERELQELQTQLREEHEEQIAQMKRQLMEELEVRTPHTHPPPSDQPHVFFLFSHHTLSRTPSNPSDRPHGL